MNFWPILIGVLLFSMFSKKDGGKDNGKKDFIDMENVQNTVGAINSFSKLGKDSDMMNVILELLSNPMVAELVQQFLGNRSTNKPPESEFVHSDGGGFAPEPKPFQATDVDTDTVDSDEFFKPVENIAGVEVSEKLKHLYDNWYTKK